MVRFGYDGTKFRGWARQPALRTVEGEILAGLRRRGLLAGPVPRSLPVASRTDAGVSARGNALRIASELPGPALLRALNGLSPDIVFSGAHRVANNFVPRHALYRRYRYFEPIAPHDVPLWRSLLPRIARPIDARSFGRGVPQGAPVWREISRAEIAEEGPWMVVELTAPSFVWGMVRKIIAAFRAVEAGDLALRELDAAVTGERPLSLPLAEPEPLVLWEVGYPFTFEITNPRPSLRQQRYWNREIREASLRAVLLERLAPTEGPAEVAPLGQRG